MVVEYIHIGIPVLSKKEGMTYNEDMKFWVGNVNDYDFKIEYLRFEEGISFLEVLSKQLHMVYRVDDLDYYVFQAQRITLGPVDCDPGVSLAFVTWDDAIVKLYRER